MLDPLPTDKEEIVRCPVDGCNEKLEKDDMRGYSIYYCDVHGEVEPVDFIDDECPHCGGTGEITTMEKVYPDEGSPLAPIGTQKCICRVKEPEYDNQE